MEYEEIKSFSVNNYKSIKDSGDIAVGGLSVILGPNSSGKTNILEPLLLMKQSMENVGLSLTINGDDIKLGSYRDIVHKHETQRDISYEFKMSRTEKRTGEDHKPLECPICSKGYKEEGWYIRHIEKEHEFFWEYTDGEISKYESFLSNTPSVELVFSYSEKTNTNKLSRLKFNYPKNVGGLYVSDWELFFEEESIRTVISDIDGKNIIDLEIKGEETIDQTYQKSFRNSLNILRRILSLARDSRGRLGYIQYSKNQPYIANQYIPTAEKHSQKLSKSIRDAVNEEDTYNIKATESSSELDIENLSNGLIDRLGSVLEEMNTMFSFVQHFVRNISHVGPLRRNPQRIYFGSGESSKNTYSQSVDIEERLLRETHSDTEPIIEKTNMWLQQTGFNCKLNIEEVGVGDAYQLEVIEDGIAVNVADSGFGLSQTLPILVECINMEIQNSSQVRSRNFAPRYTQHPEQHLTIIEEPEIHLNPRIESAMADFFISINNETTGVILETHSEHILNRIQRRVADGTIDDKDDISIYFVSKEDNISSIKQIEMEEDGAMNEWPAGFFQDDLNDAIEMLKHSFNSEGKE